VASGTGLARRPSRCRSGKGRRVSWNYSGVVNLPTIPSRPAQQRTWLRTAAPAWNNWSSLTPRSSAVFSKSQGAHACAVAEVQVWASRTRSADSKVPWAASVATVSVPDGPLSMEIVELDRSGAEPGAYLQLYAEPSVLRDLVTPTAAAVDGFRVGDRLLVRTARVLACTDAAGNSVPSAVCHKP
jgi:hypothetical protein